MDTHSFVARNFAHLYAVGGRQHSMDTMAKMQEMPDYFGVRRYGGKNS